jgi:hypothetical protein
MSIPSEYYSLQNAPPLKSFLTSEYFFLECSSPQNVNSFRTLQKAPPLKLFLSSEKPPFKIVLHCFSIQKVSHFRMFRIPEFSFLQNAFHDPSECSSLESDPPLKAFLPSECSSLESVPPLRMFLP